MNQLAKYPDQYPIYHPYSNLFGFFSSNNIGMGAVKPTRKCIGAGYRIQQAERDLKIDIPNIERAANTVLNVGIENFGNAVNNWIDFFYGIQTTNRVWLRYNSNSSPGVCTQENLEYLISSLDETKDKFLTKMKVKAIEKGGRLVLDRTEAKEYKSRTGTSLRHPAVERYAFILDKPTETPVTLAVQTQAPIPVPSPTPISNPPIASIVPTVPDSINNRIESQIEPFKADKAGVSPLLVLVLATSAVIYLKSRSSISKNKVKSD